MKPLKYLHFHVWLRIKWHLMNERSSVFLRLYHRNAICFNSFLVNFKSFQLKAHEFEVIKRLAE